MLDEVTASVVSMRRFDIDVTVCCACVVVICLQRGENDLHMVQLMPLPPHHLLLHQNLEWFTFLVPAYPLVVLEKRLSNGRSSIAVVG